jgi:hypothetical protein
MDARELRKYLEDLDACLEGDAVLVIYGSAAFMLLGEVGRTSLDIDVAGPYCILSYPDLEQAARKAGLEVDPDESYPGDHIEWVRAPRLCLPGPQESTSQVLWRGKRLTVTTVSPAELVASKLIRYDEIDAGDVRFLCIEARVPFADVKDAVGRLPPAFRDDPVLRENLASLEADMASWRPGQ